MNSLKTRLELQGSIQEYIESFMYNNNISAAMMEDALNKVLLYVKDKAVTEFLIAAQQEAASIQKKEVEIDGDSTE